MTTSILFINRKYLFIPVLILTGACVILFSEIKPHQNNSASSIISQQKQDSVISIRISAVGDLMCHSTQFNYARVEGDSFNFVPCFDYVSAYLKSADLLIGNLETTLRGPTQPYSGYPYFNSPDDYAGSIAKVGFDFLVTANNHCNDTGEDGIIRTIRVLDGLGLSHTGSFISQHDRDSIRIENIDGIKIAIIAYTYSTNGNDLAPGKPWLANYCDSALIKKDVEQSRLNGAEVVLVFFHFGEEYQRMPSDYQKNFVSHAIDCGADLIIGSHPHVLQPVNFYVTKNAKLDTGFVAFSLGNFISNQSDEYTDEGIILNIRLEKNTKTNKIRLSGVNYIPTWVYKGKNPKKKLHVILPAQMVEDSTAHLPEFITPPYVDEMKKAMQNTRSVISTYTNAVQPADTISF